MEKSWCTFGQMNGVRKGKMPADHKVFYRSN